MGSKSFELRSAELWEIHTSSEYERLFYNQSIPAPTPTLQKALTIQQPASCHRCLPASPGLDAHSPHAPSLKMPSPSLECHHMGFCFQASFGRGPMDERDVRTCARVCIHVCIHVCMCARVWRSPPISPVPVRNKPYLPGSCWAGPEMLSAAPQSCWWEPTQTEHRAAPRLGCRRGPTPPSHPLGQLPMEPGARYQASAGWTPSSSCWLALGLQPSLPTGAGCRLGNGASELSFLAPTSHPSLQPSLAEKQGT